MANDYEDYKGNEGPAAVTPEAKPKKTIDWVKFCAYEGFILSLACSVFLILLSVGVL
jgi:hypothetical protein